MTIPTGIWPFKDGSIWKWCLVSPLAWEMGKPDSGFELTIDAGFVSDLVTIPGWAKPLVDENSPATARAAIIHDALLAQGFEQRVAAGEFYRVLIEDGVPLHEAQVLFVAVLIASDNWLNVGPLSHAA